MKILIQRKDIAIAFFMIFGVFFLIYGMWDHYSVRKAMPLDELTSENIQKGKYIKSVNKFFTGTFISNAKGFGFVEVDGIDEDFYVPEDKVNGAFHKDTVQVALLGEKAGKRQEVQVVKIIARGMNQIVGTYQSSKNFGFVIPDNGKLPCDIFVPIERSKGAVNGHKVVVELTDYGSGNKNPEGKVVEILGHINDPGVDIMSIVKGYELPVEFSEKIMNQVENVSNDVSEADMA
jgi:ribonuclease R